MQKDSTNNCSWIKHVLFALSLSVMVLLTGCASMSQDSAGNPYRFNPETGAMGSPGWDY